MGQLSKILRSVEGGGLMFCCPGCGHKHLIYVGPGSGPRWIWNADVDLPTFTPSIIVTGIREDMDEATQAAYDALPDDQLRAALDDPRFRTICHSFVREGRIQFLTDCTHALAGQTVAIPPFEDVN